MGKFNVYGESEGRLEITKEGGIKAVITKAILEKIPIPLQSGTVFLTGTVSHISVTANCTVCGIRFMLSGEDFLSVVQFIKECTDPIQ